MVTKRRSSNQSTSLDTEARHENHSLDGATSLLNVLRRRREEILAVAARHGAQNIRIFGSVARGEADERSDIDLLVDMEQGRTLFDMGGLQIELEALIGRPVDVTTERGLKHRTRVRVLQESVPL